MGLYTFLAVQNYFYPQVRAYSGYIHWYLPPLSKFWAIDGMTCTLVFFLHRVS